MKSELSLDEMIKLNQLLYRAKQRRKILKNEKLKKAVVKTLVDVCHLFYDMFKVMMIALICALAGVASEHVIYVLNQPLGLGYAHYASYGITGLLGIIILYGFIDRRQNADTND